MTNATQDNHDEEVIAPPHYERRRGLFGAIGIGVVAAIADMAVTPPPAFAGLSSPCCTLATNTKCSSSCSGGCSSCSNFHCPSGYKRQLWFCVVGSRPIGCGECCKKPVHGCYSGPFACSIWWDDGACP